MSAIFKHVNIFFLAFGTLFLSVSASFAQSQSNHLYHPQPDAVYTYHGAVIAPPPQDELTPVASRSVTTDELTVRHNAVPAVTYPDGDINEPVALDDEGSSTHEASLVTTRQLYDRDGNLLNTTKVDHREGE